MSVNSFGLSRVSRVLIAASLGAVLLAGALVVGSTGNANAESVARAKKTTVLGAVGEWPDALCPIKCSSMAIVSGFQSEIDGVATPYRVPFAGKITKWKIRLGKPSKSDRNFFETRFGTKPKAGLSVLKPVTVKGKKQYKLMKRSPIFGLNKYLGATSSITLDKPIKVKKGYYVALTVPTWAPILGVQRVDDPNSTDPKKTLPDPDFNWRASRERGNCGTPSAENSSPQTKPGSKFEYGCRFYGAQLLYRVKVVSN